MIILFGLRGHVRDCKGHRILAMMLESSGSLWGEFCLLWEYVHDLLTGIVLVLHIHQD